MPIADIVIGVADEVEGDAMGEEGAEALPPDAGAATIWMVLSGRPSWPWRRATSPDSIAPTVRLMLLDLALDANRLAMVQRSGGGGDQRIVDRLVETVILRLGPMQRLVGGDVDLVQQSRQIDALRLPVIERAARVDPVDPADHLVERAEAHLAP